MAPGMSDMDLYELLGLLTTATLSEIKKAYRKRALTCHPDKNPDNPRAAKDWEELSKALEILADTEARAAYDKVLKAKKANELRNRALESKRRKVKEDLEAREAAYRDGQDRERGKDDAQHLQEIIKRLQEEGSRILEEEQRLLKEELKKGDDVPQGEDDPPRLKLRWKSKKTDDTNGGYSYDFLYKILQKYGAISSLLLSSKKKGSAVVEFDSSKAAELAARNELGLSHNPLELSWLSGRPKETLASTLPPSQLYDEADFESQVLQKLRNSAAQQKKSSQRNREGNVELSSHQGDSHGNTLSAGNQDSGKRDSDLEGPGDFPATKEGSLPLDSHNSQETPGPITGCFTAPSAKAEAKDYESLVLMKMRQNAERQRLIQEMAREDMEET